MKLTILGTAPGKSLLGNSHTSYLIQDDNSLFLIDCGEGTTQKILEKNLSKDELDMIIISHLHPDHLSGLFILLQTLYLNKRKKDLFLFLPESVDQITSFMEVLYIFKDRFGYKIITQLYDENSLAEIRVFPFNNSHLIGYKNIVDKYDLPNKLLSYSFVIKGKNKSLLLSSDIRSAEDIQAHAKQCEIMILDGIHPSYQGVKELIEQSNTEVYITHGDFKELQLKYADILSDKVKVAKENEEIIF
ncbi:MBL fold metallo-hydrolase [bacterium]|nr:MBL fold metallo-hydrolase [bacterium]